jgi:hypothetical protein
MCNKVEDVKRRRRRQRREGDGNEEKMLKMGEGYVKRRNEKRASRRMRL